MTYRPNRESVLRAVNHLNSVDPATPVRPASRTVRAWLYAQAAVYALAAWAVFKDAFITTQPGPAVELDSRTSFPGIRFLVLTVGLLCADLGALMIYRGIGHRRSRDLLAAPSPLRPALHRLGHVGAVARGVMFLVPGAILVVEAWIYRHGSFPTEGLHHAVQTPYGRVVLVILSIGLAAFAVYELAAAVYRREPDDHAGTGPASLLGVVRWRAAAVLIAGAALLWAVLVVVGRGVVSLTPAAGRGGEQAVDAWLAAHRTAPLTRLSAFGSGMANTMTVITVTGVVAVVLVIWLGRWRETATLVVAITGELVVFVLVTAVVHRARPLAPHLDPAPPTSSFPSGHTGAAVAVYGCIALVMLRELRRRGRRASAVVAATGLFLVPLIVAVCRVYRGMHFPSDVLAGAAAGGAWLALVFRVMLPLPRHLAASPAAATDRDSAQART